MKTKSLYLLYGIVAVLALGVFVAKKLQNRDENSSAKFERGYKPFEDLSAASIATVEIRDSLDQTTITIAEGKWSVAERGNYPVNVSALQGLLRTINDLVVTQSLEAGASYDARFGLDEAVGTTVTLKKKDGATITTFKLGKEVQSSQQDQLMMGGSGASGRYLRLESDANTVYVTNNPLSEVTSDPTSWLAPDFLKIENITKVSFSKPGQPDEVEWSVSRANPAGSFVIEGEVPEGKVAKASALSSLGNLFSFGKFEDILMESSLDATKTQRAQIQTQDGFLYTLEISPLADSENKALTIQVAGDFPEKRTRPEVETVEEGNSADEVHAMELEKKKEKLAKQKELEGITYEVSNFTVQALVPTRGELFEVPQPAGAAPQAPQPRMPFPMGQ